jgi:hypothetical protein
MNRKSDARFTVMNRKSDARFTVMNRKSDARFTPEPDTARTAEGLKGGCPLRCRRLIHCQ